MGEPKKYPIPDDLKKINLEVIALAKLRDSYIKRFFGYIKSKKAAIECVKKEREFLDGMIAIYPDLLVISKWQACANQYVRELKD